MTSSAEEETAGTLRHTPRVDRRGAIVALVIHQYVRALDTTAFITA